MNVSNNLAKCILGVIKMTSSTMLKKAKAEAYEDARECDWQGLRFTPLPKASTVIGSVRVGERHFVCLETTNKWIQDEDDATGRNIVVFENDWGVESFGINLANRLEIWFVKYRGLNMWQVKQLFGFDGSWADLPKHIRGLVRSAESR
jgi:hypothetical protein